MCYLYHNLRPFQVMKPSVDVPPPTTKRGKAKVEPTKVSADSEYTAIAPPLPLIALHDLG